MTAEPTAYLLLSESFFDGEFVARNKYPYSLVFHSLELQKIGDLAVDLYDTDSVQV